MALKTFDKNQKMKEDRIRKEREVQNNKNQQQQKRIRIIEKLKGQRGMKVTIEGGGGAGERVGYAGMGLVSTLIPILL